MQGSTAARHVSCDMCLPMESGMVSRLTGSRSRIGKIGCTKVDTWPLLGAGDQHKTLLRMRHGLCQCCGYRLFHWLALLQFLPRPAAFHYTCTCMATSPLPVNKVHVLPGVAPQPHSIEKGKKRTRCMWTAPITPRTSLVLLRWHPLI
jgi:hypothetical protein